MVIGLSALAEIVPLAAITLPLSTRRPMAALGSLPDVSALVTRMISGPVRASLESLETTTLLASALMVMPLAVAVRVPPIRRLPAPSPSRLSAEICR
jgi:hypothetical protein